MASKCTKRVTDAIVKRIERGEYPLHAALAENVNRRAWYRWLAQGRREAEEGKTSRYSRLVALIESAEARAEGDMVEAVGAAAKVDGRIGIDMMGRRFPERWSPKQTINVEHELRVAVDSLVAVFTRSPEQTLTMREALEIALRALSEGPDYVEAIDVTGRDSARALVGPGDGATG